MAGRCYSSLAVSVLFLISCGDGTGPEDALSALHSISDGDDHACLLQKTGVIHCWGWGGFGQLGAGDTINYTKPIQVTGGKKFTSITTGSAHSCAIARSGAAWCWGGNAVGALGKENTVFLSKVPILVDGGLRFRNLSAGTGYTCGVATDDTGFCWGSGGSGELGNGVSEDKFAPVEVSGNLRWDRITTGLFHSCGITTSGAAYCWGDNLYGNLGTGDVSDHSTPVPVNSNLIFKEIGAGYFFTCGLTTEGRAFCWGSNVSSELGNGNSLSQVNVPVPVAGGHIFRTIEVGGYHTCGITPNDVLYCWGANTYGKLGTGDELATLVPVPVIGGHHYLAVSTGANFSCGITADDGAYCWGWNGLGQLGNGEKSTKTTPTPVDPSYLVF